MDIEPGLGPGPPQQLGTFDTQDLSAHLPSSNPAPPFAKAMKRAGLGPFSPPKSAHKILDKTWWMGIERTGFCDRHVMASAKLRRRTMADCNSSTAAARCGMHARPPSDSLGCDCLARV